jgi:hypothetical protein
MTDEQILAIFEPLFERFSTVDRASNPPLLAHYTSIQVMEKILQSNEVWFSNPLFMNDLQELRFGVSEGTRLFFDVEFQKYVAGSDARAALFQQALLHFYQEFERQDAFDTYVFCLSEHHRDNFDGLLSMWRGYGQHGNGVALVFDAGAIAIVPTSPLMVWRVRYLSDSDRLRELNEMQNRWADILKQANLPDDKLYIAAHAAFSAIKTHALTTKHIGFAEEAEWRVVYTPERDRTGLLKNFLDYNIGERGVEPKLKYRLGHIAGVSAPDLTLERILERIVLGPSLSSPLARRSVERMLEKIGRPDFKTRLHPSGIPLRSGSGGGSF